MTKVLITAAVLACSAACVHSAPIPVEATPQIADSEGLSSLRPFWREFRLAARLNDPHALADLARFPFELYGSAEATQPRALSRQQFVNEMPSWLGMDPGTTAHPTTMHALIDAHSLSERDLLTSTTARVGSFGFERTVDGWRFARVHAP